MSAYYNEFDPIAAEWLRELIRDGLIAPGEVDERSICDVQARDLRGFDQVHLFAGVGGWSAALRLAGWDDDRPVWSGSAPCQDFSNAGKRAGHGGSRNLWPEMLRLIRECRPAIVFGEQVASAIRYGWLDGVCTDLEAIDYGCGAAVLPACGVGAPHIRSRIFWLAYAGRQRDERRGDARDISRQDGSAENKAWERKRCWDAAGDSRATGGLADADDARPQGRIGSELRKGAEELPVSSSLWQSAFIPCRDGKLRRVPAQSGVQPLVDAGRSGDGPGVDGGGSTCIPDLYPRAAKTPGRVAILKGAGNMICVPLAAEFIRAAPEILLINGPSYAKEHHATL